MPKLESQVKSILKKLRAEYPNSRCSLDFTNPYELLVGTILSAQSTDERVNLVLPSLFAAYPTPLTMAKADLEDIKDLIKTVGLYNNKAKSLKNMSQRLVDEFDGEVPAEMRILKSLPGVGRKTANVVLGNAFRIPSGIAVDTHVIRLTQRIGLTKQTSADKIEKDLLKIVPEEDWIDFTHLFIDHGRKICGRKPLCDRCVLNNDCEKNIK